MLTTHRARVNGPLFVLGWLAGLAAVGAIVLSVAGPAGASSSGSPATWVSWVKVGLGLLLLLVAARQFRARPKDGGRAPLPKWMAKVDDIRPLAACGLAALLAGVNPKNLLLAVGGAASIAQTGISAAGRRMTIRRAATIRKVLRATQGVMMAKPFRKVGEGRIKTQLGAFAIAGSGLCVGQYPGEPITEDYPGAPPYQFAGGVIDRVGIDVSGEPYHDLEREAALMLMRE